jgi:hypothetical protein
MEDESWERAFDMFMQNASQRDRDVVSGCQYYYESRDVVANRSIEEERKINVEEEDGFDDEREDDDDTVAHEDLSMSVMVSLFFLEEDVN